jgi:serine/threonine-protein kinase
VDVGETGGIHYVAYEDFGGETLEAVLRREGKFEPARAVKMAGWVLAGLAAAAKHKLVHGDVKPENVFVDDKDRAKLAGLGLARMTDEDASSLSERGRIEHYGAPEQVLGEARDSRSDVYGAGALLYRMVSGGPPLEAGSLAEVRGLVQAGELPRPGDLDDVPENVRKVLSKMLAETPKERYSSPKDAGKALRKLKV